MLVTGQFGKSLKQIQKSRTNLMIFFETATHAQPKKESKECASLDESVLRLLRCSKRDCRSRHVHLPVVITSFVVHLKGTEKTANGLAPPVN